MKKRKTTDLYNDDVRNRTKNTDEYINRQADEYEYTDESDYITEYEADGYDEDSEYMETDGYEEYDEDSEYMGAEGYDEGLEYPEGEEYIDAPEYMEADEYDEDSEYDEADEYDEDSEYIVDYQLQKDDSTEDYEQALYEESSLAIELREEVFTDENAYMEVPYDHNTRSAAAYGETINISSVNNDSQFSDEYYQDDNYYESGDYAEDTESYYDTGEEYYSEDTEYYESDEYGDDYYESSEYDDYHYEDDDSFDVAYGSMNQRNRDFTQMSDSDNTNPDNTVSDATGVALLLETIKKKVKGMSAFDAILTVTGVVVVVAAIVIFSMYMDARHVQEQIEAIAPVGDELINVGIVGEEGLLAMTDAALMGNFQQMTEEASTVVESVTDTEETVSNKVNVSFVSVERDLKIRFTDANTGELIKGTMFEVTLTKGNDKKVLKDDDMDGVIYATGLSAGSFDAVITSTDKYKFPTVGQQVKVKDKVEYVVINVEDEVKSEAEVNVSVEDTQKQDAEKEAQVLKDTVEWVESTKTLISGSEEYLLVDKNTITDPSQVSKAASRMLFDKFNIELDNSKLSLYVGGSATLSGGSFTDSAEGDVEYKYTTEWKSSNEEVATVSGGTVTGRAKGKAIITCTVTKKTITTTYEPKEPVEETLEISVEDYEALEEAEKEKCTPKKDDADQIIGYTYKKVTQPQPIVNETAETASAECVVTVDEVKIASASLELAKSADACKVGETITVTPSKLVYTMEDNTVQNITEGFPEISWSSDNKEIAKIDEKGVVTGVKAGTATITAKIKGLAGAGDKKLEVTATTTVTVTEASLLSIKLDRTSEVYLNAGGTTTLVATVENYKEDSGVTWTTSDEKVATVDEKGVVTGVAAGSAKITATTKEKDSEGKNLTATCVVTINTAHSTDTTTKLKDKNGNQIYIKKDDGSYKEAVYADYYNVKEFYIQTQGQYKYTGWQTLNGKTYYYDKNGNPVTGAQVIQGVTYNFGADGAIATKVNGSTFGIDISRHNGNIDWNAVKASGVDYVILRCGYRGSATGVLIEDESFKKNIKGATAAGLKVGVYVFSQAINEVEAVKEASLAVSLVKGYNLTYPIFIDTESSGGRADRIDVATRTAVVNAFCRTVASAGYQPGIYASKTWFEDELNMSAIGNYKIWLAQYSSAPTYKGRYDMWQYTSKGKINGIKGDVDLNWSYMGY